MINYHLSAPHLLAGAVGVDALIFCDRRAAWACGVTTCGRAGVRGELLGRVRGREVHQGRVIIIIIALDTYLCFLSRRTEATCRSGYSMCLFTILCGQSPSAGRHRGSRAPSGEERPRRCLLRALGHNSGSTGPQLGRLPVYVKLKRRHVSPRP